MEKTKLREPKQKRSIEKKQRIILASYKLFCKNGYYKTNTVEIAQEASVSTGIVYSYFTDKKDILLDVISHHIASVSEQLQPFLSETVDKNNLSGRIEQFFDIIVASHTMNVDAHNEFLALSYLEKDIHLQFELFEKTIIARLCDLFIEAGFSKNKLTEKIKLGYGIVEQISHGYIQKSISQEELMIIKPLAIKTIVRLFTDS